MEFNKKGMMDDLFDFLFTVFVAFFVLMFVHVALSGGVAEKEKAALGELEDLGMKKAFLGYLQAPGEGGLRAAEMIVFGEKNLEIREKLKEFTQEVSGIYFSPAALNNHLEKIEVVYPGEEVLVYSSPGIAPHTLYLCSEFSFPSLEEGEVLVRFKCRESLVRPLGAP